MPELTAADFEALGLYAPAAPHAAQRLELLEYLVSLGATADDLVTYRDELPGLATVLATRGGGAMRLAELGGALTEFGTVAADTVTSGGGRRVKLTGDEVLFTAKGEASACKIALNLT